MTRDTVVLFTVQLASLARSDDKNLLRSLFVKQDLSPVGDRGSVQEFVD